MSGQSIGGYSNPIFLSRPIYIAVQPQLVNQAVLADLEMHQLQQQMEEVEEHPHSEDDHDEENGEDWGRPGQVLRPNRDRADFF